MNGLYPVAQIGREEGIQGQIKGKMLALPEIEAHIDIVALVVEEAIGVDGQ